MTYVIPPPNDPLAQGDMFDDCPLIRQSADGTLTRFRALVVVLTQTCDLVQLKAKRVVVAVVQPAEELVRAGEYKPQAVRDQIRRSQVFGVYFLPAAPTPIPVPESLVELRDLHTIDREVLDSLVTVGKRVGRLATPYREHLAQHFAVTYMRIALPEPYETRP